MTIPRLLKGAVLASGLIHSAVAARSVHSSHDHAAEVVVGGKSMRDTHDLPRRRLQEPASPVSPVVAVIVNLVFAACGIGAMFAGIRSLRRQDSIVAVLLRTNRSGSGESQEELVGSTVESPEAGQARDGEGEEDAEAETCHDETAASGAPVGHLTFVEICLMTSVGLAYGTMLVHSFTVVGVVEAEWLQKAGADSFFGSINAGVGIIGLSAVSSLAGPVAGCISDASRSPYGRRRPVLLVLTVIAWVATFLLNAATAMKSTALFTLAFFVHHMAYFAHDAVFSGLMTDFSTERQASLLGGLKQLYMMLGIVYSAEVANLQLDMAGPDQQEDVLKMISVAQTSLLQELGGTSALLTVICTMLACAVCREESDAAGWLGTARLTLLSRPTAKLCQGLVDCTRDRFGKLVFSRMFAATSATTVACTLWFVQDMFQNTGSGHPTVKLVKVTTDLMRIGGGAVAVGAGFTTLRLVRKLKKVPDASDELVEKEMRRRMNHGCLWMAILWFFVPIAWQGAHHDFDYWGCSERDMVEEKWTAYLKLIAGLWGLGQGVNLAAGEALVYELTPRSPHYAMIQGWSYTILAAGVVAGGAITAGAMHYIGGQTDAKEMMKNDFDDRERWAGEQICDNLENNEVNYYREAGYEAACRIAAGMLVLSILTSWLMKLTRKSADEASRQTTS
mmetsp:Transcript_51044/g.94396  ORF Transcript_51044/g.94396 Transcript_51044/m.94396 type:complete len:677 (-) Transcript_51044:69-2099(-)